MSDDKEKQQEAPVAAEAEEKDTKLSDKELHEAAGGTMIRAIL